MKRARMILLPIVLVIPLLALASCGGGDENGDEGTKTTTTEKPGDKGAEVSEVVMSEFKFEPSDVTVKKGDTITVPNEGSVDHDLKVREKGGETLGGIEVIGGGKSAKLKVDFDPGEYEMFCSVPGHEEAGMVGAFTVVE